MVSEYRGRAEAAADKTQLKGSDNPGASSLHTIPQVPNNPSSSTPHPGSVQTPESDSDDETEEEDWKSKGAAVLRYRPHTGKLLWNYLIYEANLKVTKSLSTHMNPLLQHQTLKGVSRATSMLLRPRAVNLADEEDKRSVEGTRRIWH